MSDPQAPGSPEEENQTQGGSRPQYAPYVPPQAPYAPPQAPYAPQPAPILPPPGPGEPFDGASHPADLSRPLYGATFGQAISRFFKNYANFSGRASRSEYWWVQLFIALIMIVPVIVLIIGIIAMIASSANSYAYSGDPSLGSVMVLLLGAFLMFAVWAATLIPMLALGWRRLHDGNFPGPLYLITLGSYIPFINYIAWLGNIAILVLTIMPSKPEGRRFLSNR